MKKILLLFALLGSAVSLSADSNYLNLAYVLNTAFLGKSGNAESISFSFTNLYNSGRGLYIQFNPYYGLAVNSSDNGSANLSDSGEFLLGANTILGYGFDIKNGNIGVLVGFGGYIDTFFLYYKENESVIEPILNINQSYYNLSLGLGVAANAYIKPGKNNLVINVGLKLGWAPLCFFEDTILQLRPGQSSLEPGIGIGWNY